MKMKPYLTKTFSPFSEGKKMFVRTPHRLTTTVIENLVVIYCLNVGVATSVDSYLLAVFQGL